MKANLSFILTHQNILKMVTYCPTYFPYHSTVTTRCFSNSLHIQQASSHLIQLVYTMSVDCIIFSCACLNLLFCSAWPQNPRSNVVECKLAVSSHQVIDLERKLKVIKDYEMRRFTDDWQSPAVPP